MPAAIFSPYIMEKLHLNSSVDEMGTCVSKNFSTEITDEQILSNIQVLSQQIRLNHEFTVIQLDNLKNNQVRRSNAFKSNRDRYSYI